MKDVTDLLSDTEGSEILDFLQVDPHSLVEHNQRVAISGVDVGYFGSVYMYQESTKTWIVQDDYGSLIPFDEKLFVKTLELYKKVKIKDTGPYAIVNQSRRFTLGIVSNDYQTLNRKENYTYQPVDGSVSNKVYDFNASDFDAFISTNYKSSRLGDEHTFADILTFWCAYPYEQMPEYDSRLVFQHSLQSIWANIDDVTKKPLSQESIHLLRAHIWNCIITRDHTMFPQLINGFLDDEGRYDDPIFVTAYKEATAATLTEESMAEYLRTELEIYQISDEAKSLASSEVDGVDSMRKGFLNTFTVSMEAYRRGHYGQIGLETLPQAMKVVKDLIDETYEDIGKTTQGGSWNTHVNITFMDTSSSASTKICRISVDQPLKEVFQIYALNDKKV